MSEGHLAYLSIGSNLEPTVHLPQAIHLLKNYGQVKDVSSAWQSHAVGFDGPDFLNICLSFISHYDQPHEMKEEIIRPIEAQLGRVRTANKNAPRTIDLDILLFDGKPLNLDYWEYAFVIVPLEELLPDFEHPTRHEKLLRVSEQLQSQVWIARRGGAQLAKSG